MAAFETRKKPVQEYIYSQPRWLSAITFPLLSLIVCLLIAVVSLVHYPQVVNVSAVVTAFDTADRLVTIEMDVPENKLFAIDVGQSLQFQFKGKDGAFPVTASGAIEYIYGITGSGRLKARIYLPGDALLKSVSGRLDNEGGVANARIIIRDMRLIQYIISGANHS